MPLARIFTHHPERTTALSRQLQEQGYTVEVVHPDQAQLSPADLEIEFEICERADVLERAAGLADELQADVAVAPGAIQAAQSSSASEAAAAQEHDREREFEAAFTATEPGKEQVAPVIEIPVMERAPLPPVAFADEPPAAPLHSEVVKPADPVPYLAQLMPFGTPQVEGEIPGAELRLENSAERPALVEFPPSASAAPAQPSIWQRGANFTAKAVTNARAIAASTAAVFRERSQEYQMKAKIRSAEARAAHEARLLDLEQRRAEAQQRATELEAAREAAAARLVELVRQRDPGLHEQSANEQSANELSLHGLSQDESAAYQASLHEGFLGQERKTGAVAPQSSRPTSSETWWHAAMAVVAKRRRRQPMSPQLRAVLTGAAAVSVLFVIGIVLGSLYPRTPMAQPSTQTSNAAPSGSATKQNGSATAKASAASQDKPSPAKASQSSAAAMAATETPASAQDKPTPRAEQVRRIAAQQGEEELGDDVVVRHFQRPVPTQKPKQSGQEAGLKHFSDLDVTPSQR